MEIDKSILIISLILFLPLQSLAQAPQPEKTRAHLMYDKMHRSIMQRNFDLAQSQVDSMYQIAIGESDSLQIGFALQSMGKLAELKSEYEKSDSLLLESISLFKSIGDYGQVSLMYSGLAGQARQTGDIDKSFEYAYLGRSFLSKTNHQLAPKFNSNILSLLYSRTGQLDSAIHYQLLVIEQCNPTDSMSLSTAHLNLAASFRDIGNQTKEKEYLDLALAYAMKKGLKRTRAEAYYTLSNYEKQHGSIDQALEYAYESLKYFKSSRWSRNLISGCVSVASALLRKGDAQRAKIYIDSVENGLAETNLEIKSNYLLTKLEIEQANQNQNINQLITLSSDVVNELDQLQPKYRFHRIAQRYYRSIGDYQKVDFHAQEGFRIQDSLSTTENRQILNNMEAKYMATQRDLQIENLKLSNEKQKQRIVGGSIALGLISVLLLFLTRLYRKVVGQRKTIQKALKEKDLLLREIHHRVKNNLQLVSSLLTLQGRSIDNEMAQQAINEGKSRVRSMALIHQDLYHQENLTEVNVKTYLEKLSSELFTTYRIDEDRIQLHLDIDEIDMDVDKIVPLGLIINELLTNSLKYAFPDDRNGEIQIKLKRNGQKTQITIDDNGIGYDPSKSKENSFGTTLISALTQQLEGELNVTTSQGTKVSLLIP